LLRHNAFILVVVPRNDCRVVAQHSEVSLRSVVAWRGWISTGLQPTSRLLRETVSRQDSKPHSEPQCP